MGDKDGWSEVAIFPIEPRPVAYRKLDPARSCLEMIGAGVCKSLARLFLEHPAAECPSDPRAEIAQLRAEAAWWRHCFERYAPASLARELAKSGTLVDSGSVQFEGGRIVRRTAGRKEKRVRQTANLRRKVLETRKSEKELLRRRVQRLYRLGQSITKISTDLGIDRHRVASLCK